MDKNQPEAVKSLHKMMFQTRTDPTQQYNADFENGRADILASLGGRSVYIECKNDGEAFPLENWRDNQRKWAAETVASGTDYYLWLTLGIDPPNRDPLKYLPRLTWLVPYHAFLSVDSLVKTVQDTLIYRVRKGHRKEMQRLQYDAVTLLQDWRLQWNGGGIWLIPHVHPFHRAYVEPQPLPVWEKHTIIEGTHTHASGAIEGGAVFSDYRQ